MRYHQTGHKTARNWLAFVLALLVVSGSAWAQNNEKEKEKKPQPQHAAPQKGQAAPERRQAAPERRQAAPQPQHAAPQPQHAAPQPQHAAPQQRQAAPQKGQAAPQQRQAAPERRQAAPQQHAAPQPQHAAPQQRQVKPFTPPHGAIAKRDNRGGTIYKAPNGSEFHTGNKGQLTSLRTRGGAEARFGADGGVRSIHSGGMVINHGPRGGRIVETHLSGGGRVVVVGAHRGFVERPFEHGGRPYMRRTYVYGGHPYAVVYRGYHYRGLAYYGYVPPYYYAPAFYGWAYNPWAVPVSWRWGWAADPWYGYYGYYFRPYPVYPYPALWLTDFLLAETLRAGYEAQAPANAQAEAAAPAVYVSKDTNANGAALTPETKQAIADEVKVQLAAEQAAANPPQPAAAPSNDQVPEALDPKVRTFIVSNTLSQPTADGTTCSLSSGDVLTRIANTPDANQNVQVLVTSSQTNDCQPGTQLALPLQDLQDMHNDFRQKIDAGLQTLADNQGKNGMVSGPPADPRPVEEGQAQPDTDATVQLDQQQQDADRAEAEVQQSM